MSDVPQPIINQLESDGVFPAGYSALIQGAPHSWVKSVEDALPYIAASIGAFVKAASGDPDAAGAAKAWKAEVANKSGGALSLMKDIIGLPPGTGTPDLAALLSAGLSANDKVFEPIIAKLVDAVTALLSPPTGIVPSPGDIGVNPDGPVAAATGVAFTAAAAAWIASYAGIDAGETLAHIAELIAAAIGWEELRDVTIGPLVREGIARVAIINARKTFLQTLPNHGTVASWLARGLITQSSAQQLAALDGLNSVLFGIETTAASTGLNPRQLVQLLPTGLLQPNDITDELNFAGMRASSQARFQLAAPYLATARERESLKSALENAYIAGLLSDADYTAALDSAEQNTNRDNLALTAARWKQLTAVTKDLEAEYTTLYVTGLMTDATFRNNLAAIGLQPTMVNAIAAKAEARAEGALNKNAIRQAAELAKATAAKERQVALENYKTGKTNLATTIVALAATGLTTVQAAAFADLAQLQQVGNQRWTYGLQLTPQQASILRARVSALVAQRETNEITDAQLTAGLNALGIPAVWVNAIRAGAIRSVTPATNALAIPIQTS